jgi:hypothetical protein
MFVRVGVCVTVALVFVGAGCGVLAAPVWAEACPNEQFRAEQSHALSLPDCRAYEQVSPAEKNGVDAIGSVGVVRAATSGEGFSYFSEFPFPGVEGAGQAETYVSMRGPEGWATEGLLPKSPPNLIAAATGLTEDLSQTFIEKQQRFPSETSSYLRDHATRSLRKLGAGIVFPAGASANDSNILFESSEPLLKNAAPGVFNLYDLVNGELTLAGVLPNGKAPPGGSVAGAGAHEKHYTENAISRDGSRVFFTDSGTGQIYVRVNGTSTIEVSQPQESPPVAEHWLGATTDGRYVFLSSEAKLTKDATASPEHADLYRFDVEHEQMIDLTTQAPGGAGVPSNEVPSKVEGGMLGISTQDGSYAYFVAESVLTNVPNARGEKAAPGHNCSSGAQCNLYEWHNGTIVFIARLGEVGPHEREGNPDSLDWTDFLQSGGARRRESRVTPDGTRVLFGSHEALTGYDNAQYFEYYLFNATAGADGSLTCVTCNPSGAVATHFASLADAGTRTSFAPSRNDAFVSRNLSVDGSRVFFDTEEALVPEDTNGQRDVYEWDRGHLYLISSGRSASESYFGDASPSGDDVFFFTRQALVSQDRDENVDVYDARVGGGIPAQNPAASPTPCGGEECRGAAAAPVSPVSPVTLASSGAGNVTPAVLPETVVKSSHHAKVKKKKHKRKHRRRGRRASGSHLAHRGRGR